MKKMKPLQFVTVWDSKLKMANIVLTDVVNIDWNCIWWGINGVKEYAILTNEIYKALSRMNAKEYKSMGFI